jgi:hypothetical protein
VSQLEEKTADSGAGGAAQAVVGAAGHVAGVANEQGKDLAAGAVEELRKVGGEAALQAQHVVEDARRAIQARAQSELTGAASGLRRIADQGQALVEGRPEEADTLVQFAERGVERVRRVADSLDSRGPEGVIADLQRFARRRPGAFLAMAGVGGFLIGRMVRSGALSNQAPGGPGAGVPLPASPRPEFAAVESDGFAPFSPVTETPSSPGDLESPWLDLDADNLGTER